MPAADSLKNLMNFFPMSVVDWAAVLLSASHTGTHHQNAPIYLEEKKINNYPSDLSGANLIPEEKPINNQITKFIENK
jgi:hypothetical protein